MTAGVSAALLAGAGAASADSGPGAESNGSASSDSAGSDSTGSNAPRSQPKSASDAGRSGEAKPDAADPTIDKDKKDKTGKKNRKNEKSASPHTATEPEAASGADEVATPTDASDSERPEPTGQVSLDKGVRTPKRSTSSTGAPQKPSVADVATTTVTSPPATASTEPAVTEDAAAPTAELAATQNVSARSVAPASLVHAAAALPAAPEPLSVLGVIQGVIGAVVVNVGSVVVNTVQAVEALVTGPPVVPPGSTVTVRSSTVQLSNGQRVAANWFYPKTETGEPPTNMILLQHGFFALGPMYSYTAASLAEETHSVVVTTTLSSNPFAGDSFWLGGTAMSAAIADLFVGDRAALTASAVDAGYATTYGLDPAEARLPQKFALAGHSLGANLVSGAAGFLVDKSAADDLVGVILLDGVPVGTTLPDALAKLDAYAASTGGHYIPVREIGAPFNLYNSLSNVNADLTAARPDRFNGVVLDGGVHSDPMRGGNPLIQFALYVAAGFPQPQNPPAVDELSAQWFNEWFAGNTDEGDGLVPGTTIDVPTPQGTAHGVVIGNPPEATLLRGPIAVAPSTPTTIPTVNPTLAALAA